MKPKGSKKGTKPKRPPKIVSPEEAAAIKRAETDEGAAELRQARTVRMSRGEWQALPLITAIPCQEGDVGRALHGEGWLAAYHGGVWVEYPVEYIE